MEYQTKQYNEKDVPESNNHGKWMVPMEPVIPIPDEFDSVNENMNRVPFWFDEPNILIQKYELFPSPSFTNIENLNAISRLIIILTIIGFFVTRKLRILIIGLITLFAILVYYKFQQKKKEGFDPLIQQVYDEKNIPVPSDIFDEPKVGNPFSNVLLPDIMYHPDKKPAPPCTSQQILESAKQTCIELNKTNPDIVDKLFTNMGDQFIYEQSLQPFYSNAGTTIPNDNKAFQEFCYGSMVSSKEGNLFSLARNRSNYNLY